MPDPISWELAWPYYLVALAFGYAFGSIPFGLIITRFAGLGDVRSIGSGNIGATNVLRTGRKSLAALTLLFDALKGTAPVLLAGLWGPETALIAGLGAFIGHLFPVWLGFKGGKGVATYIGVLLGLKFLLVVFFGMVWIATAVISRYSSLSALVASLLTPVALYWIGEHQLAELFALLTCLLWIKHHANIRRLLKGEESRIGK
ncbi:glycerol-3-phosphate 1-O-acyltransferase PlsY [Coralliovum pocilloporae]|uniref:glycerol-3-phosphate 1-O-acyltransferase PlsY n=1 Tax=Coralliovum pocilloporae TaxID=3066369 RepID=UPI003306E7A9